MVAWHCPVAIQSSGLQHFSLSLIYISTCGIAVPVSRLTLPESPSVKEWDRGSLGRAVKCRATCTWNSYFPLPLKGQKHFSIHLVFSLGSCLHTNKSCCPAEKPCPSTQLSGLNRQHLIAETERKMGFYPRLWHSLAHICLQLPVLT